MIGKIRPCKRVFNPNIPDGIVFFYTNNLPASLYKYAETPNIVELRARRDWYTITWPETQRRTGVGTYGSFALPVYMPAAWGILYNIIAG